jgi:hypothetical protein
VSKAQNWGSVSRLAWVGLGFVGLLSLTSGVLFALIIIGVDDSHDCGCLSRSW